MGYSGMLNRVSKLEENGRLSVPLFPLRNFTVSSTLCAFRMIYIYTVCRCKGLNVMFLILSKGFLKRSHNMHTDMTRISTFYTFFPRRVSSLARRKLRKPWPQTCFFFYSLTPNIDTIPYLLFSRDTLSTIRLLSYIVFSRGGFRLGLTSINPSILFLIIGTPATNRLAS